MEHSRAAVIAPPSKHSGRLLNFNSRSAANLDRRLVLNTAVAEDSQRDAVLVVLRGESETLCGKPLWVRQIGRA